MFSLFALLATLLLFLIFGALAVGDDARSKVSLEFLSPIVTHDNLGEILILNSFFLTNFFLVLSVTSLVVMLILDVLTKKSSLCLRFYPIFVFSVITIICFLHQKTTIGILFITCSMLYAAVISRRYGLIKLSFPRRLVFDKYDLICVTGLVFIAIIFRIYALNRVSAFFEGELTPYFLGAIDWRGILLANAGVHGPWAPLGLLYYLPIHICYQLFGVTLLSVRLASVLTSILTIFLLYVFLRYCWSRTAAVVGSLLLTFESLQIGWGRTDVHPHGSNSWPTLLLCLVIYKCSLSNNIWIQLLLIPAMALTWHQYPSGQSALLIPFMVWIVIKVSNTPSFKPKLVCVVLLVGFLTYIGTAQYVSWLAESPGSAQNYAEKLGPRFYAYQQLEGLSLLKGATTAILSAYANLKELISAPFIKATKLFHQDIFISLPNFPIRTFSWGGATLAISGLILVCFTRPRLPGIILYSWIIAGLLPAIFSDAPFPKRASTIYPALCAFAGVGAQYLFLAFNKTYHRMAKTYTILLIAFGFVAWYFITTTQWFSNRHQTFGIPGEYIISNYLCDRLSSNDVVAIVSRDCYFHPKFIFAHYNCLISQPDRPVIFLTYDIKDDWFNPTAKKMKNIMSDLWLNPPYYYYWSPLKAQFYDFLETGDPKRIVYIIQLDPIGASFVSRLNNHENLIDRMFFESKNISSKFAIMTFALDKESVK